MNQALISVIIPTYNHARFLCEAIRSVLNQTYGNFEAIIIDNYSEDNTEEIVMSFDDKRIKYFKFRNYGVIAASRNFGIKKSIGDYIAFLDADDIWHKQKLEKQLLHFHVPGIVGVASDARLVSSTPYYRTINFGRSKRGYIDYNYKDILLRDPIITSSLIVRKDLIENVGFFDESRDFSFIEDWELWLRMARYGSFRVLDDPLLFYFVSRRRGYQASEISKNCLKVIEKQVDLGYVTHLETREPRACVYQSIARSLLEFDSQQSRLYYSKAFKNTSVLEKKVKSYIGIILSYFPIWLKKAVLLMLYKVDRIFSIFSNLLWKVKKLLMRR